MFKSYHYGIEIADFYKSSIEDEGLNRTIMELKFHYCAMMRPFRCRLNRTIMELKSVSAHKGSFCVSAFKSYHYGIEICRNAATDSRK